MPFYMYLVVDMPVILVICDCMFLEDIVYDSFISYVLVPQFLSPLFYILGNNKMIKISN